MEKASKRLKILGIFTFILSPLCSWGSVTVSTESAVFASLSRMIWFSGSATRIFIAMLFMFVPMIVAFFYAHNASGLSKSKRVFLRILMLVSCFTLYFGAMWLDPGDGIEKNTEGIWHGILSIGGMFMIFLTYCIYVIMIRRKDKDSARFLAFFLAFVLITGFFAVTNIVDDRSYVGASAISELYVLTAMSLVGYFTYYLAYRKGKENSLPTPTQQD